MKRGAYKTEFQCFYIVNVWLSVVRVNRPITKIAITKAVCTIKKTLVLCSSVANVY